MAITNLMGKGRKGKEKSKGTKRYDPDEMLPLLRRRHRGEEKRASGSKNKNKRKGRGEKKNVPTSAAPAEERIDRRGQKERKRGRRIISYPESTILVAR